MPWAAVPTAERDLPPTLIADVLDPVLTPLGFAPARTVGGDDSGQVIFSRGRPDEPIDGDNGCIDLVLDLGANHQWQIVDVRSSGFPADRWHLEFERDVSLADQQSALARTPPPKLA